jgi:hypothetical protein
MDRLSFHGQAIKRDGSGIGRHNPANQIEQRCFATIWVSYKRYV